MTPAIVVCGSMAFDILMRFEGRFSDLLLADQLTQLNVCFLAPTLERRFGGCAGNISYGLHLLGAEAFPVATVGHDAKDYLAYFQSLDIDTRGLVTIDTLHTAAAFITTDCEQHQLTTFHPGAMAVSHTVSVSERCALLSLTPRWAIVAPDSASGMLKHLQALKKRSIQTIFDPGQGLTQLDSKGLQQCLALADIVVVNQYEGHLLEKLTQQSCEAWGKKLSALIVTAGPQGSTLYQANEILNIPPAKAVQIIDPTGCGDAYRAGLLQGLNSGQGLAIACRLGSVMGALKIAALGAQAYQPLKTEIRTMWQTHYGPIPAGLLN